MAISTYQTYLMYKSSSTYNKLVDIKDFPELGGAAESIDTTTLSDSAKTYIPGIKDQDTLEFTANYTSSSFDTIAALEGTETDFAVWFGGTESGGTVTPSGDNGKFEFKGYASVHVSSGGVNDPVEMKITILVSTPITKAS